MCAHCVLLPTDNLQVVMATAEVVWHKGRGDKHKDKPATPVAVSAFRMQHDSFVSLFSKITGDCPGKHKCKVTCQNNSVSFISSAV